MSGVWWAVAAAVFFARVRRLERELREERQRVARLRDVLTPPVSRAAREGREAL